MQKQTSSLLQLQQQVSTGRRILTPADDPIASAQALGVSQSQSINTQFQTNQGYANDALSLYDSKLSSLSDTLVYIRTRVVEAGNGTYSQKELDDIASDLRAQFDSVLAVANSQDSSGAYIFAGYKTDTKPFPGTIDSPSITYQGDQGERSIQVSSSRQMPVSDSGDSVFSNIPGNSTDVFTTIKNFITTLETPGSDISTAVSNTLNELDNANDNVLKQEAAVGSRQNELDALGNVSSDLDLQYSQTLSRLQDVDYVQAISDLTQQQTYLQASQQSFLKITGLSLFNYLS